MRRTHSSIFAESAPDPPSSTHLSLRRTQRRHRPAVAMYIGRSGRISMPSDPFQRVSVRLHRVRTHRYQRSSSRTPHVDAGCVCHLLAVAIVPQGCARVRVLSTSTSGWITLTFAATANSIRSLLKVDVDSKAFFEAALAKCKIVRWAFQRRYIAATAPGTDEHEKTQRSQCMQ